MHLNDWIWKQRLTQREAAELLDVAPGQLSRYRNRQIIPSLSVAARIEDLTGGAVDMRSWLEPEKKEATPEASTAPAAGEA